MDDLPRCFYCGCFVELGSVADGDGGPVVDRRIPEDEFYIGPAMCWDCRGVVFLDPPEVTTEQPLHLPWCRESTAAVPVLRFRQPE